MDPTDNTVYWSQGSQRYEESGYVGPRLYSSYLNGTSKRLLQDHFAAVAFAFDYGADNIYWSDTQKEGIYVTSLQGMHQATLIRGAIANDIALDISSG